MKLTQKPLFRAEDFPGWKDSQRLFNALNPFITNLNQILDNNIDYTSNIRSVTRYFSQTGITLPLTFSWPYNGFQPQSLDIVKAKVDGVAACLQAAWDFNASENSISISAVYQLGTTSNTAISETSVYEFTVRVTV